jgi:hypothetical protein
VNQCSTSKYSLACEVASSKPFNCSLCAFLGVCFCVVLLKATLLPSKGYEERIHTRMYLINSQNEERMMYAY